MLEIKSRHLTWGGPKVPFFTSDNIYYIGCISSQQMRNFQKNLINFLIQANKLDQPFSDIAIHKLRFYNIFWIY